MKSFFLLIIVLFVSSKFCSQNEIALWNYNTIVGAPTAPISDFGTGTSSIVGTIVATTAATGMDPLINNGCGAQNGLNPGAWSFTATPGLTNESNGVQYTASTVGYQNIKFTWDQRWSNTATNTVRIKYTTDGSNWIDFVMTTLNTTFCNGVIDGGRFQNNGVGDLYRRIAVSFASIPEANNNANFAVRILAAHYQATGEFRTTAVPTTIATGGTWRFDNVKIEGAANISIAAANNFLQVAESVGTVNVPILVANANPSPVSVTLGYSVYSNASDGVDFTMSTTVLIPANTNGVFNHPITIIDDALAEKAERIIVKVLSGSNALISPTDNYQIVFIKDNDYLAPTPSNALNLTLLTSFSNGAAGTNSAEIIAFDSDVDRLYIANSIGAKLDIVNFSNPSAPVIISSVSMAPYGNINSVVAHDSIIALAIENANPQLNGSVVFLDYNGNFLSQVTVGAMPDMITFNQTFTKILTANEGEPNATYTVDPEGSVSVIDLTPGYAALTNANVTNIGLTAYNGQQATLSAQGIRVFPTSASVAQDLEPEYITISDDNTKAYVGIQEANALLTIDLLTNTIISLAPLGYSSYNAASGNALDASDQSGAILITGDLPIKGAYMPDALSFGTINNQGYIFSANEGDSREFGSVIDANRISSATFANLDATAFPDAAILKNNKFLGRLNALKYSGDTDGDGDYDELHVMSGRSFSIWNATTGALVYDSKDLIEQITSNHPIFSAIFNASNSAGVPTSKNRSDDKGPEVEGIAFQIINGKPYVFVSLERIGGVMLFNVQVPGSPVFVGYYNNRSTTVSGPDLGAEGIITIPAATSPNGNALVILANEVSSTLSIYQINTCATAAGAVISAAANAICAGSSTTLSIPGSVGSSYQWLLNGQVIPGEVGTQYTANQVGSYTVFVTSQTLTCNDTSLVKSITLLPSPIVTANSPTVCVGSPTTLVGAGALTYVWTGGITNGVSFVPLVTSPYVVTGTNAQGCTATATATVTVSPLPTISAGIDQTVCGGTNVTLTANGATSYVWNNGATGQVLTVPTGTSASSSTYFVTGTNLAGCSNNDQVVINVLGLPSVNAGIDFVACAGDTIALLGSGAITYSWNNGVSNNSPFVVQSTQTYTLTGIDANLCQNTDQVLVTVNPTPTVTAGSDIIVCSGASVVLLATGAQTHTWTNGVVNGQAFIPAGTVNYTVTGTNAFGCQGQDQLLVTVNSLPVVLAGNDATICQGDSLLLQATGAATYTWDNGQVNGSYLQPTSSSLYSVIGIDSNNCEGSAAFFVTVNPNPTVLLVSDTVVCDYNLPLQLTVLGNASSFVWSNGTSGNSVTINQAGTYNVTGELNGCSVTNSVLVTVDGCIGISEVDELDFKYFPNPTSDQVLFSFNQLTNLEISVYSLDGKELLNRYVNNSANYSIDFKEYTAGTYLVKLSQHNFTRLVKVIKN
jgi:hypothetical protein